MGNSIAATRKGIKLIITFIIAIALYICIAPTEASAAFHMWYDGETVDWDTAVTNSENSPIDKTIVVTIDGTTAGGNVKVAPAGRVRVTGTGTVTGDFSMDIDGGTVTWEADLTKSGTSEGNFIEFGGGGSLTLSYANIEGAAKNSLIYINSAISGVTITGSSFTNEINADGSSDYGKVIYSESTGTMSISDYTTISYTGNDLGQYALTHGGNLSLSDVTIDSEYGYGINHPTGNSITLTRVSIEAAGEGLLTNADGTITNTAITSTSDSSNAVNATGNLTFAGTSSVTASKNHAIAYNGASGKTLSISGGTYSANGAAGNSTDGSAVYLRDGSLAITGGTFSTLSENSNYPAVYYSNAEDTADFTISGADIDGGSVYGVYVATDGDFEFSSNTISGSSGIYISDAVTATISGGTVTGTGASGNAIYCLSGNLILSGGTIEVTNADPDSAVQFESTGDLTVSGADIIGNDAIGIVMKNPAADLIITSGDISGTRAVYTNTVGTVNISGGNLTGSESGFRTSDGGGVVTISGGTFDGGDYGIDSGSLTKISPAAGKVITVKGTDQAINGALNYTDVTYNIVSAEYDGDPFDSYLTALSDYDPYQFVQFSEIPKFTLTISGGTANSSSTPLPIAVGSTVDIAFNPAQGTFIRWEAQGYTLADPTVPNFQMTMPLSAVTLTAIYEKAGLPPAGSGNNNSQDPGYMPVSEIGSGEDKDFSLPYLEKHAYKNYETYVWKDFSVTPAIKDGVIDEKTAYDAIKAAARRANSRGVTVIKLNIPEGTEISDKIKRIILKMQMAYGVEVVINYLEAE
jgi:hypothetical protein